MANLTGGSDAIVRTKKCEDCDRTRPSHRWASVRAQDAGWFTMRDGRTFCPEHVPEWVEQWRRTRLGPKTPPQKCPTCGSENIEENDPAPGEHTCRDCGEWIEED